MKYTHDKITLIHGDCMDYMADLPDKAFDLSVVDPPYGININSNMGLKKGQRKRHKEKKWDTGIPNSSYFEILKKISNNQIIWGGNYFPLGVSHHVIWWEKDTPEGMSFSSGELAWTSFNMANRSYKKPNITGDKIHPTQKPVALYKWLLKNYAKTTDRIIDTHLGSGSSAIAAWEYGCEFVGIEIDKEYYDAAVKRFKNHVEQQKLF
jgi:site-specific DNA-methyltransferase (adenine-specific)